MTRLAFRAALEIPRPRSALVLVGIASLTLAVSGQIHPVAIVLQIAAITTAALTRSSPAPWQRNALVLNAGLAASALLAVFEATRGAPATVSLAQFALLASGLQLLDARPRRSEFLLVALALFQVVLASSLTDSLLFPPLLMAFLPTCVWTLLVHTLRTEALESGDPAAATEAITPGLLGMTLVASILSLVLALGLFFLLPRLHDGLVRGGAGATKATGGFSDRVELGDLGRIRGDPRVMLRVETVAGNEVASEDAYWRGLAFDHFDGRGWSVSIPKRLGVEGDPSTGLEFGVPRGRRGEVVERILREPMPAGVLFGSGEARRMQGSTGRVERDSNGGLYAPQSADARVRYEIAVRTPDSDEGTLARDRAVPPPNGDRYLELPPLPVAVAERAAEITAGLSTDVERARALERWLRVHGRYSDTPPPIDPDDPESPVARFVLGDVVGHCEYFASAMVVMARSQGLPARLVNGFAGGRRNSVGDFVELTGSDAHAWVEVHFEDAGWVRFDPTPPDLRLAGIEGNESLLGRWEELRSALELLWFQHVVEFDRSRQAHAAIGAWSRLRGWLPRDDGGTDASTTSWGIRLREFELSPAVAIVALVPLAAIAHVLSRRNRDREPPLPRSYARALRLLARRGFVRPDGVTPRAFARRVATDLDPRGAAAFQRLTEDYLAVRFGGRPATLHEDALRALRDSLRA